MFVNQRNNYTGEAKCRIFDTKHKKWEETDKCFSNGHMNIGIVPGPNGLMAIYNYMEGHHPVVSVVKWSRRKGWQDIENGIFYIYYMSTLGVYFYEDSPLIYLVTPSVFGKNEAEVNGKIGKSMASNPYCGIYVRLSRAKTNPRFW